MKQIKQKKVYKVGIRISQDIKVVWKLDKTIYRKQAYVYDLYNLVQLNPEIVYMYFENHEDQDQLASLVRSFSRQSQF